MMTKQMKTRPIADVSNVRRMYDWMIPFMHETKIFVEKGGEIYPAGLEYVDSGSSGIDEAILIIRPLDK
jgi:hypothetical protein